MVLHIVHTIYPLKTQFEIQLYFHKNQAVFQHVLTVISKGLSKCREEFFVACKKMRPRIASLYKRLVGPYCLFQTC